MVTAKLYRRSDPEQEIDRRELEDGELSIGRDPVAGWQAHDPTKALSRLHCILALRDGRLTLRDESTNGVFLSSGERLARGVDTPVRTGEPIALGGFLLKLEDGAAPQDVGAPAGDGADALAGKLLDAFCAGAQIDPSLLAGEDPHEVMRTLGAIYREMVAGLGGLMSERTRAKTEWGLERTTIQVADNNPFRWAPPRRVAVDLLKGGENGFQSNAEAVRSSFEDIGAHHRGSAAGWRAMLAKAMAALSPAALEAELKGRSLLGKPKPADLWERYVELHGQVTKEAEAPAAPAFRDAYEAIAEG